MVNIIKTWWANSTGFRHAVTTWLGVQLAVPLGQVLAWAQSQGQEPLPDWHQVFVTLGFATLAALISGLLKTWQQDRAFPAQ